MIDVTIYRKQNQIECFELSGHADSGPYGYDLVCAGVSAVSFGAVNAVLELCEDNLLIEQEDEGGFLRVAIPDTMTGKTLKDARLLFEGMLVSLKTIEQDYSEFISVKTKEGGAV